VGWASCSPAAGRPRRWSRSCGCSPSGTCASSTRFPIARLHYTKTTNAWTLYWRDRNQHFHAYEHHPPTTNIDELIVEIERDPPGIFWG